MTRELEEIHSRFDKAQIELTTMTEEKDRVEVEARKFRNQLDHARQSLDNTYESETRIRQELELVKRDYSKLQDKLDQAEAERQNVHGPCQGQTASRRHLDQPHPEAVCLQ